MAVLFLPRLPSNWSSQPEFFSRAWNTAMTQIETLLNEITQIPEIQTALETLNTTVSDVSTETAAATEAAATANAAADTANAAAATATAQTQANKDAANLTNSYVTPANCLSASLATDGTATISIAANTRTYGDGSTASVNAGTITGLLVNKLYYVYYHDTARTGGSVTYLSSTSSTDAAQVGDVHTLGSVTTPASGTTTPVMGSVVRPPGVGSIPTSQQ